MPLKYKGTSYLELLNFIYRLENRFLVYTDNYSTNAEKVVYAASSLQGSVRTRWRSYVRIEYQNGLADITWEKMLEWLHEDVTDDVTRSLEALTKLREIRQKEGQTFHQFHEEYSAIEEELPYKLPAMFRVSAFLDSPY